MSVAEHGVMMMLTLVRNYIPAYTQVINGEWDVAKIAQRSPSQPSLTNIEVWQKI